MKEIKFDFEFYNEKIEFLDTLVSKNHNNLLQTTLYKKSIQTVGILFQ